MSTLQPQEALIYLNTFSLPALRNEFKVTTQIISAIPVDKGDYKPDPFAKSASELAWHIASAEHAFLSGVAAGSFEFGSTTRTDAEKDSAGIAAWYEKHFEEDFANIAKMSGEQLVKVIDFHGMFQLPAIAFIQFNLHHIIHHRGQLSTYLRPMGAKVPAIYGESYDSKEAKKAATS
jgi:uncharacterized damage-inducible protein DinB